MLRSELTLGNPYASTHVIKLSLRGEHIQLGNLFFMFFLFSSRGLTLLCSQSFVLTSLNDAGKPMTCCCPQIGYELWSYQPNHSKLYVEPMKLSCWSQNRRNRWLARSSRPWPKSKISPALKHHAVKPRVRLERKFTWCRPATCRR